MGWLIQKIVVILSGMLSKLYSWTGLLVLLFLPALAQGQYYDADWLEQGLLAEFRGDYEEALEIWDNARKDLEIPDSRIGFEYIRLVTEQELNDYYADASDMYFWALEQPFDGTNRAAVRQEIERLRPIAGKALYRQWITWFEDRSEDLSSDMKGFWIQMDPTPGSDVNERLIEHWHRIAYSRALFVKNSNTIYGTDDRALIYLRYGEPDRSHAGVLTLDRQNIGQWLAHQFDASNPPDDRESVQSKIDMNRELVDGYEQLEEYVFQFHQYPEFEIWIYEPLVDYKKEPLIFIFGTDVHTGEYRNQRSIDDFIPRRAYLSDRRSLELRSEFVRAGLTPALVLQMLYYEQLREVDHFFEQRLDMIRESFVDQGPLAYRSLDLSLRSQNRELLDMRINESPQEASTFHRKIPPIPVDLYQYRMLDDNLNQVLVTFLESQPLNAFEHALSLEPETQRQDPEAGENTDRLNYFLDHELLIYSRDWQITDRLESRDTLTTTVDEQHPVHQSWFITDHRSQQYQTAVARLAHPDPQSSNLYSTIFPDWLRGLGSLRGQQPRPLRSDGVTLEMADLILGYRGEIPDGYPFSFKVINDQTLPADESLMLHFEVYNLHPDADEITRFELTYRIFPVLEDGTVKTDEEAFYLTINFEQEESNVKEDLEIQTALLESGLYELQVFIEDMESRQDVSRSIRFEVTR